MAGNCNDIFSDISYENELKRIEVTFKFKFTKTILKDPDPELRNYPTGEPYKVTSTEPPQLHRGVINMYIYASICQPIHVGHTQVPLLKNIFVDSSKMVLSLDMLDIQLCTTQCTFR